MTVLPYAALWNLDPYAVHQAASLKSRPRPHDVWFDFALRLKSQHVSCSQSFRPTAENNRGTNVRGKYVAEFYGMFDFGKGMASGKHEAQTACRPMRTHWIAKPRVA